MKHLILDMDGVLADIYARLIAMEQQDTGKAKTMQEVTGVRENEAFPRLLDYVHRPVFRHAPVAPDSQRVLAQLNASYDVSLSPRPLSFR